MTPLARQVQKSLFFDGRISRTEAEAMKDLFCPESDIAAKDLAVSKLGGFGLTVLF